jgi:low temperature requirement protein LtrA
VTGTARARSGSRTSGAEAAAQKIACSDDPGRLGRSAYHLIHPVMVAGIIVCAAADEQVLSDPGRLRRHPGHRRRRQ